MVLRLAAFELRQQLRSHVFWIVCVISLLMVVGALWVPELRVGLSGGAPAASPTTIARTHLVWSLFYMFTAAAFAADAVLRDDLTGFAPIIGTMPVARRSYLLGRFAGGFAATVLCFLSVPAGLLLILLSPAVEASGVSGGAIFHALFILALPNLFTSAALFFALATALRSMLGTLLGAVALLSLYGAGAEPGTGAWSALIEPFGFAAWARGRDELLLLNRLVWVGLSLAALAALVLLPTRRSPAPKPRSGDLGEGSRPAGLDIRLPNAKHGRPATLRQLRTRTSFEVRQLVLAPTFTILLLLGLGNAAATIWRLLVSTPSAAPPDVVAALIDAFDLVPIVVALFFAGELVWSEREHRVEELIGASPAPELVLLLPKLAALALALLGLSLASAGAALAVPTLLGHTAPSFFDLFSWYVAPRSFDWLLVGILALFFQAVSPNKLAGWGLMVLYLIASLALEQAGFRHPLYRYGSYPGYPLPEALSGAEDASLYRAYWAALALLLLILGQAMLSRGRQEGLRGRARAAGGRLSGAPAWLAASAALLFGALGVELGS